VSEGTRMSKISVHFQAGMDAYESGDYGTALKEFRPLADQGFAAAQHNLGIMYAQGHGVAQDYQEAVRLVSARGRAGSCVGPVQLGGHVYRRPGAKRNGPKFLDSKINEISAVH